MKINKAKSKVMRYLTLRTSLCARRTENQESEPVDYFKYLFAKNHQGKENGPLPYWDADVISERPQRDIYYNKSVKDKSKP